MPECLNLVVEYRNTSQIPSLLFMAFLAALPKGCNSFAGWSSGGKIPAEKYIELGGKYQSFWSKRTLTSAAFQAVWPAATFAGVAPTPKRSDLALDS